MSETGFVVKTETSAAPGGPLYLKVECPDCKVLREQLVECRTDWMDLAKRLARQTDLAREAEEDSQRALNIVRDMLPLTSQLRQIGEALQTPSDQPVLDRATDVLRRLIEAEALAGEALEALSYCKESMEAIAREVEPPNGKWQDWSHPANTIRIVDRLLATDAAKEALARREREHENA